MNQDLFQKIDRVVSASGPLTKLVDWTLTKLLPQSTVLAACGPVCNDVNTGFSCLPSTCPDGVHYHRFFRHDLYQWSAGGVCNVWCDGPCVEVITVGCPS
jgi:hypothetical protein